jgi:hypothetical protein
MVIFHSYVSLPEGTVFLLRICINHKIKYRCWVCWVMDSELNMTYTRPGKVRVCYNGRMGKGECSPIGDDEL